MLRDGSQFDWLFDDGDRFEIASIAVAVLHVPSQTPADLAYVAGDAVFARDTIFVPDAVPHAPTSRVAMLASSIVRSGGC